jgi:hypothetical protein
MATIDLTSAEFDAQLAGLTQALRVRLTEEITPDEFSIGFSDFGAATDLWELPEVPSKAVVKLSGLIEDRLGVKLPPKFIRSGGYKTVEEAVDDLVRQLRTMCRK